MMLQVVEIFPRGEAGVPFSYVADDAFVLRGAGGLFYYCDLGPLLLA